MRDEKLYLRRLKKFADAVQTRVHSHIEPLQAEYIHHPDTPIPYTEALQAEYRPIAPGEVWGLLWGCAWFRLKGIVPTAFAGQEVGAIIDLDGEGCVFKDGTPWIGLSGRLDTYAESAKAFVPLFNTAHGHEAVELLIEAGANTLFGEGPRDYRLQRADLVTVDRECQALLYDLRVLLSLVDTLPERSPRRQKILRGLNNAANVWKDGAGMAECHRLTTGLLTAPANASALTAWSMGHAHIDLGWLWPVRETKRKGGRTFSTALRLLERYPEYRFGSSQPQLYQWMKDLYPALYEQIRAVAKAGRWECQGVSWVEMDTNLTGGESLIRQILYGKRFFREEFGQTPEYLFLPDCFGFSAALPQILCKSGAPYFLTQKMSWSETNTFPHHSFRWQGIDGSQVRTHFLPTNDYNGSNTPQQLIAAEQRFAQSDVADDFANLYGIGDGGGGPSEAHIEYALRQRNLEGSPKVRFDSIQEFFHTLGALPEDRLPVWSGELYLEMHRGTYTTQARMKRWNRKLELLLHDVEFLSAVFAADHRPELESIWKDTLLDQFHDILPGSSIGWVYRDAEALSEANYSRLKEIRKAILSPVFSTTDYPHYFLVMNPTGTPRTELVRLPISTANAVRDASGKLLPTARRDDTLECLINLPAYSYTTLAPDQVEELDHEFPTPLTHILENELLRVEFDDDGSIVHIFDKEYRREWLAGNANRLQLWEDLPNRWGAWDINHFYRETEPENARLIEARTLPDSGLSQLRQQTLAIGKSTIEQRIELVRGSRVIRIANHVDWKETHKMLRVQAIPAVHWGEASYEIQFGLIRRPTTRNTSWDTAKFETVGHRFVDLSQPDGGFALLNDCKYGHSIEDNVMEINLLRSPADVDPNADMGMHEFTFAYLPHAGDLAESTVVDEAHALNSPLLIQPLSAVPKVPEREFFRIESYSVKLETVKLAEDDNGLILRFYETTGCSSRAKLIADQPWAILQECDLMENTIGVEIPAGNETDMMFSPFEIKTLRLLFPAPEA